MFYNQIHHVIRLITGRMFYKCWIKNLGPL